MDVHRRRFYSRETALQVGSVGLGFGFKDVLRCFQDFPTNFNT